MLSKAFAQSKKANWQLIWSDEFDYTGLPDAAKWNYDTAGNSWGWGNKELQHYTHANSSNAMVSNGTLKIIAQKQAMGGKAYTSARLTSKGKGDWLYGKIEVRAKLPMGNGTWPAIWMLPSGDDAGMWPACGEIDIMEHTGAEPDSVLATVHTGAFNHTIRTQKGNKVRLPTATTDFEVYTLEWFEQEMIFYAAGTEIFRFINDGKGSNHWPFFRPFHLLLNLAIGGTLGGKKGVDESLFPQVMEVDYVRVYKQITDEAIIQRPTSGLTIIESAPSVALPMEKPVYKNVNGIVSIHADMYTQANGWRMGNYYTGKGMLSQQEPHDSVALIYEMEIDEPGNYALYVLGNRQRNTPVAENELEFSIEITGIKNTNRVQFYDLNAPAWAPYVQGSQPSFYFPKKGMYNLQVKALKGGNIYVEKIILSAGNYRPQGTGLPGTFSKKIIPHTQGFDSLVVLPPHWAFGILYGSYTNQAETVEAVNNLRKGNFPIDAFWIDSWFWDYSNKGRGPQGYINFTGDTLAFPNKKAMWQHLQKQHIKGGIWIWDCLLQEGNEQVFNEFETNQYFRNTFINKDRWHNKNGDALTGNIDFENPDAVAAWHRKLKPLFDDGVDFLKLDRSSAIPFTKAAFEATQHLGKSTRGRGFVMAHLHSTYDPRFKMYPTKWTGDAKIAWSQPDYPNNGIYAMGAFKENVEMIADPKRSTYEIPFLTHDAGGYDYFGSTEQSDELYMRWIQFSSLNTLMTIFSQHTNPTKNLPYYYNEKVQENFRKYTHLRMQLFPYIYTYALRTRLQGKKMVQGDGIHHQQYLFGNELLVAPVVEKGATQRTVYLPAGKWYDIENDSLYSGTANITVAAPIEKIPVFARAGAIIPKRNYAPAIELGSNDTLTLEIYTGANGQFDLLEDDGLSNDYLNGTFAATKMELNEKGKHLIFKVNPIQGDYKGIKKQRTYILKFHGIKRMPKKVKAGSRKMNYLVDQQGNMMLIGNNINVSSLSTWKLKF